MAGGELGDVVIGFLETHDRQATAEQIGDLETVPRRSIEHRGATFTEMDLDAVLARAPDVALVDEYAHTNVPGSRNTKRWQDVDQLLDAGIDVVSTVNIQHLESLNDVVEQITGIKQRETVPDARVRSAEQTTSSTSRRNRSATAWPAGSSTTRRRSTQRSATSSAPATSGRCGN